MFVLLILYILIGLLFVCISLWWMRDEKEPWVKSIAWAVGIGALWPIALVVAIYHLFNNRWI